MGRFGNDRNSFNGMAKFENVLIRDWVTLM